MRIPYSDCVTDWDVVRSEIIRHHSLIISKMEYIRKVAKENYEKRQRRKMAVK